jgi:hypothetical protein
VCLGLGFDCCTCGVTEGCGVDVYFVCTYWNFFLPINATICPLWTSWSPLPVVAEVSLTSAVGMPIRRSYVVPMTWMVVLVDMEYQEGP